MIPILSLMKPQVRFPDYRNIVSVLFSRLGITKEQSLRLNLFVPYFHDIDKASFIVYSILFLSTCYLLLRLFGEPKRFVGTGPYQYPTIREYVLEMLEVFLISPIYYVFFSGLVSYSLVTCLNLSGPPFWILLIGCYLILMAFKPLLFDLITWISWSLVCTNCVPLAFLGLRLKWARQFVDFDFRTSVGVCMLINIFLESSLLAFGWQLMALWSCCWIFPGLWARLILLVCYPAIYIFLMRLPLFWYTCFAWLHHFYTRWWFCLILLGLVGLGHLGVLGSCWWSYSKLFVFSGCALYCILAIPVTFRTYGSIPVDPPDPVIDEGFDISKYFGKIGSMCTPLTEESAICAFQFSLIALLGVEWYIWAYGDETYCGGNWHTFRNRRTVYETLFVITSFHTEIPRWYIPHMRVPRSFLKDAWFDLEICLAMLYEFRWDQKTRERLGPFTESIRQYQRVLIVGILWCFCGGILFFMN